MSIHTPQKWPLATIITVLLSLSMVSAQQASELLWWNFWSKVVTWCAQALENEWYWKNGYPHWMALQNAIWRPIPMWTSIKAINNGRSVIVYYPTWEAEVYEFSTWARKKILATQIQTSITQNTELNQSSIPQTEEIQAVWWEWDITVLKRSKLLNETVAIRTWKLTDAFNTEQRIRRDFKYPVYVIPVDEDTYAISYTATNTRNDETLSIVLTINLDKNDQPQLESHDISLKLREVTINEYAKVPNPYTNFNTGVSRPERENIMNVLRREVLPANSRQPRSKTNTIPDRARSIHPDNTNRNLWNFRGGWSR